MAITILQRALSFLYPIKLQQYSTPTHATLQLDLYRNEFLLSTKEAIYSQGTSYAPYNIGFRKIQQHIPAINNMLVLGTGLGSALKILQEKYNTFPESILVDIDADILAISKEYMQLNHKNNVTWICSDATSYITTCNVRFDVLCIDVFIDLHIPQSIISNQFFERCMQLLNSNGICIFNHYSSSKEEQQFIEQCIYKHFNTMHIINHKKNTIYILTKKS